MFSENIHANFGRLKEKLSKGSKRTGHILHIKSGIGRRIDIFSNDANALLNPLGLEKLLTFR